VGLFAVILAIVAVCSALFAGSFTTYAPVTLTSDRAGLVMEPGAKVKLRGVEVGRPQQMPVQRGQPCPSQR